MRTIRKDGLEISTVVATASHVAGQHGVRLDELPSGKLLGSAPTLEAARAVADCLRDLHGLRVVVVDHADQVAIWVDPAHGEPDDSPAERVALAEHLARGADRESAGSGHDASGNEEHRWCLLQTQTFLRRRVRQVGFEAGLTDAGWAATTEESIDKVRHQVHDHMDEAPSEILLDHATEADLHTLGFPGWDRRRSAIGVVANFRPGSADWLLGYDEGYRRAMLLALSAHEDHPGA
jgi:hypothetical protein